MRVRDWQDILQDVTGSDVDPEGWRAIAGDRSDGVGEDMFLGHPDDACYQLKTYAKNPFEVRGVGAQVAASFDEVIAAHFPDTDDAMFAVQQPPEDEDHAERKASHLEEVLEAHAEAPTEPRHLFEDVMDALDSPAFGPIDYDMYDRPDGLDDLEATFEDAQAALEAEFEDIVDEDDVGRGFQ